MLIEAKYWLSDYYKKTMSRIQFSMWLLSFLYQQDRSQDFPLREGRGGGGGLSDLIREMFTSSRQTGTYQWVLVEQKWAGPLPRPPLVTPLVNHYNLPSITLLLDAFVCRATCLKFWHNTSSVSTVLVGPDRLCSATFEKLLAYGATFSNFSNLEQLLAFWATFEQPCIDMFNKNRKNSHVVEILRRKHLFL